LRTAILGYTFGTVKAGEAGAEYHFMLLPICAARAKRPDIPVRTKTKKKPK
jgi:hypothetical protein